MTGGHLKAVIILSALYAASYLSGGMIPYVLFYIGLGLLLMDYLWSVTCKGVVVHSRIETHDSLVGTKARLCTEIVNNLPWPIPWVQVWLEMPGTFYLPDNLCCYTFSLGPYSRKVVSEELECKLRGSFKWGKGHIRGGGFLGVFSSSISFDEPGELEVLPMFYPAGSLGSRGWRGKAALASLWHRGHRTHESSGIRNYDRADGLSSIHWKASARTQHLLVKSHQKAEFLNTVLFLDNGRERHFDEGPEGSFEKAVSLTASIAAALTREGYYTRLILCASQSSGKKVQNHNICYGRTNLISILKELTGVATVDGSILGALIKNDALTSTKVNLIFILGELDNTTADVLLYKRSKGYGIIIFLFKLETFGRKDVNKTAREKLIYRLQSSGIRVTTVEKDSDLRLILGRPGYGVGQE